MIIPFLLALAATVPAVTTKDGDRSGEQPVPTQRAFLPPNTGDCGRKIQLVTRDQPEAPIFRDGPAAKDEALLLLAVDKRVGECPVLVTFDGTIREPAVPGEPNKGLTPVTPN